MHPRHALLLAVASLLLAAAPQPALSQCVNGVPSVRNEGAQLVLCPGAANTTRVVGGLEVGRVQSGQGSLNIATAPGQRVIVNGVDVLGELRELRQLCGACSGATIATTTAQAATTPGTIFTNRSQAKLVASDGAAGDEFGWAVAVSDNTIVVGAAHSGGLGSVYVYEQRPGGTWAQKAKLVSPCQVPGDRFGFSVAIDGSTIVVGAQLHDHGAADTGSAYVFVLSGTTWTQQAKLTASDAAAGDIFSGSLAISGNTIVVGAPVADAAAIDAGSAYVFARNGTMWMQEAKLVAADAAAGDQFGRSLAASGSTIVIGAYLDDHWVGSAYVYQHSGGTWTQQTKLVASDAATNARFGISVAISGNTIVVGAFADDNTGTNSGSAYVFTRSGTTWTEQAKLVASDASSHDHFGVSVGISGAFIVVGARFDDDAGTDSGSAYVFARNGTTWAQQVKLTASDAAAGDIFGDSVAISGPIIVVGAYRDDGAGPDSGSAYIF